MKTVQGFHTRSMKYLRQKDEQPEEPVLRYRVHQQFDVRNNIGNVISSIKGLKGFKREKYRKSHLMIDLSQIESIDMGAICLLLSVVEELHIHDVIVTGNFPNNPYCQDLFRESGFLAHMKTITGSEFIKPKTSLIVKRGKTQTDNESVGKCIKSAMKFLTGEASHFPPIFSMIQEMTGNSVEHAYLEKEHWLLGINYDKLNDRVVFTFTDNGFGILNTLYRKLGQKFFDSLNLNSNNEILNGAFVKKYSSRHKRHINRNKGLPLLRKTQDNGLVKNLTVISNDVFIDFDSGESRNIKSNFSGTYYYWELDKECLERWEKRKLTA